MNKTATRAMTSQIKIYPKRAPPTLDMVREKVEAIEKEGRDDAFFLVDLGEIYCQLDRWRRLLPRVRPFYAMKCNPDPEVCRVLADAGTGFDCASQAEMKQILDLGVHPSRIVYANPCKPSTHMRYARTNKVDLMTFDDAHELYKVKKHYPEARLLLRIQSSLEHSAKHNFNRKFGCDFNAAPTLLELARELGLDVVGVSFHVGSLPEDVSAYTATIRAASEVVSCGETLGFNMNILDIGGGFPGVDSGDMTFERVACTVNAALEMYFPPSRGVSIIAEPGRYMVTSAFTVAVNVIAKRTVSVAPEPTTLKRADLSCLSLVSKDSDYADGDSFTDLDSSLEEADAVTSSKSDDTDSNSSSSCNSRRDSIVNMYYVNDGIYGVFNNVFTDHAVIEPLMLKPPESEETFSSMVWGPTCDGLDCVLHDANLPDLEVGSWLYFHDMGAYTLALANHFNGISRPLCYYFCADTYWNLVYPMTVEEEVKKESPIISACVEVVKPCGLKADSPVRHYELQRKKSLRLVVGKGL